MEESLDELPATAETVKHLAAMEKVLLGQSTGDAIEFPKGPTEPIAASPLSGGRRTTEPHASLEEMEDGEIEDDDAPRVHAKRDSSDQEKKLPPANPAPNVGKARKTTKKKRKRKPRPPEDKEGYVGGTNARKRPASPIDIEDTKRRQKLLQDRRSAADDSRMSLPSVFVPLDAEEKEDLQAVLAGARAARSAVGSQPHPPLTTLLALHRGLELVISRLTESQPEAEMDEENSSGEIPDVPWLTFEDQMVAILGGFVLLRDAGPEGGPPPLLFARDPLWRRLALDALRTLLRLFDRKMSEATGGGESLDGLRQRGRRLVTSALMYVVAAARDPDPTVSLRSMVTLRDMLNLVPLEVLTFGFGRVSHLPRLDDFHVTRFQGQKKRQLTVPLKDSYVDRTKPIEASLSVCAAAYCYGDFLGGRGSFSEAAEMQKRKEGAKTSDSEFVVPMLVDIFDSVRDSPIALPNVQEGWLLWLLSSTEMVMRMQALAIISDVVDSGRATPNFLAVTHLPTFEAMSDPSDLMQVQVGANIASTSQVRALRHGAVKRLFTLFRRTNRTRFWNFFYLLMGVNLQSMKAMREWITLLMDLVPLEDATEAKRRCHEYLSMMKGLQLRSDPLERSGEKEEMKTSSKERSGGKRSSIHASG